MSFKRSAMLAALLATAAFGSGCRSNESPNKMDQETPSETGKEGTTKPSEGTSGTSGDTGTSGTSDTPGSSETPDTGG